MKNTNMYENNTKNTNDNNSYNQFFELIPFTNIKNIIFSKHNE